jgi:hypothetical protein
MGVKTWGPNTQVTLASAAPDPGKSVTLQQPTSSSSDVPSALLKRQTRCPPNRTRAMRSLIKLSARAGPNSRSASWRWPTGGRMAGRRLLQLLRMQTAASHGARSVRTMLPIHERLRRLGYRREIPRREGYELGLRAEPVRVMEAPSGHAPAQFRGHSISRASHRPQAVDRAQGRRRRTLVCNQAFTSIPAELAQGAVSIKRSNASKAATISFLVQPASSRIRSSISDPTRDAVP